MKRKVIAFMLAAVLACTQISVPISAQDVTNADEVTIGGAETSTEVMVGEDLVEDESLTEEDSDANIAEEVSDIVEDEVISAVTDDLGDTTGFTVLELREGELKGPVVRNLLDPNDKTELDVDKDYYLCIAFYNPAASGQRAYVSLDLGTKEGKANGIVYFNPPGGSPMKEKTFLHEYLDELKIYRDYDDPTYGNNKVVPLEDGYALYTIRPEVAKNNVVFLTTAINITQNYCNKEIIDAFRISYGLLDGDQPKEIASYDGDIYTTYNPVLTSQIVGNQMTATIDGTGIFCTRTTSGTENIPLTYEKITYDMIVPKDAILDGYGWGYNSVGSKTDDTKGTIYVNPEPVIDGDNAIYSLEVSSGYKGPSANMDISVRFGFPRDKFPEAPGNYKIYTSEMKYYPAAGGEPIVIKKMGPGTLKLVDPLKDSTKLTAINNSIYNSTIATGGEYTYMTSMGKMRIYNESEESTPEEKTYEAYFNTTNTAARITAITVPFGTNLDPVITYEGIDNSGNKVTGSLTKEDSAFDPMSKTDAVSRYMLFFAEDVGIREFTSVKAEIGKIPAKYDSSSWTVNLAFSSGRSGAYGCFTTDEVGIEVVNSYRVYNTDPMAREVLNGDLSTTSTVTSVDIAGDSLTTNVNKGKIVNSSGKSTESFVAGSEVVVTNGTVYPYSVPGACSVNIGGTNVKGTTSIIINPVIYLTLPRGINYTDMTFTDLGYNVMDKNVVNKKLNYTVENVSYLNTTEDGTSIYKIKLEDLDLLGYYDASGIYHRLNVTIKFSTAKTLETKRYELNELIHVMSDTSNHIGMVYTSSPGQMAGNAEDIYGINGGYPISGIAYVSDPPVGFGIQGLSEIMVSTAITVSKINEEEVEDPQWYTYDPSDPNSIALLGLKSEGIYSITLRNPGSELEDVKMKMFVPIPKKNVDLGDAFMDEAAKFDMDFTWNEEDLEALGLEAKYVKITGKYESVEENNVQYTECDQAEANAILLTFDGNFPENKSKVVNFAFKTNGTTDDLQKLNIWRDSYYYTSVLDVTGRSLYGDYVASETAAGNLSGIVFFDVNRNSIMDKDEGPEEGVTVTLKDRKNKIYSTTTDADGRYEFKAVREEEVSVTMKADGSMNQRFNIDPVEPIDGYVCSTVTPAQDGMSASVNVFVAKDGNIINAAMGKYYTLSYDGNGSAAGGIVPKTQEYAADADAVVSVKPDTLKRPGYKFVSWNTKKDGTGTSYTPGQSFKINEDVILYAQWTPGTFTVTFNYTGATAGNEIKSKDVVYNKKFGDEDGNGNTWPTNPTKLGYKFRDWSVNNPVNTTSIGTTYKAGSTVNITGDITLYAWWTEKTGFIVHYDTDGGSEISDKTVSWTGLVKADKEPTKNGYVFGGWVVDGTDVTDTTKFSDISESDVDKAEITLKAKWVAKGGYQVVYDSNGGSEVETLTDVTWDQDNLIPTTNPTKEKFSFVGWALEDETGDEVKANDKYSDLVDDDTVTSITLVAMWQKVENNTVHYDSAGGSAIPDKTNVLDEDADLLPSSTPKRPGYAFAGWYVGDTRVTPNMKYNELSDVDELTMTAHWSKIQYTVKYEPGNGEEIEDKTVSYEDGALLPTDDPVRNGYDFSGWYVKGTSTKVSDTSVFSSLVESDQQSELVLEGRWNVKTGYVVTYDSDGGSAVTALSGVTFNTANLTSATSTRRGYTLDGWSYNGTKVSATDTYGQLAVEDTVTSIQLKAIWTPKSGYSVVYNTDGGSEIADKTNVAWDEANLIPSEIPTKTGMIFDHWACNRSANVTNSDTFGSLADSDAAGSVITLIAYYKENTGYKVHYDTNGGTPAKIDDKKNVSWSEKNLTPLSDPTKTGYEVEGWYYYSTADEDAPVKVNSATKYSDLCGDEDKAELTLKVEWKPITYSVHFDKNSGMGNSMDDQIMTYDQAENLSANTYSNIGYTFAGWNEKADGSGTSYDNKAEVKNLSSTKDDVITLYAQWDANPYKIAFDGNGSTSGSMNNASAVYETELNLPKNQYKKTGYTFAGWNTEEDGSGVGYDDEAKVKNLTTAKNATVTLYAQWEPISYNVSFDGNESTDGSMNAISVKYDEQKSLPANEFERTGYDFDGWNTKADGSGQDYTDMDSIYNLSDEDGDTVKLYAQWKTVSYGISYDLDGGSVDKVNPTSYTIETATFTLTNPTKKNYTFAGWTGTDLDNATLLVKVEKGSTGDRSYKATWNINKYDVTYDGNGATSDVPVDKDKHDAGSTVTIVSDIPVRADHDFLGWMYGKTMLQPGDTFTMPDEAVVLKAQWKERPTVTFDTDGGSEIDPQIVDSDYKLTKPEDPSKRGYEFGGWYADSDFEQAFNFDERIPDGLTTVYAAWEPIVYTITYDLDGGTLTKENPSTYTVETPDFTLNNPTKEGYEFVGWIQLNEDAEMVAPKGRAVSYHTTVMTGSTGDLSFKAQWIENETDDDPDADDPDSGESDDSEITNGPKTGDYVPIALLVIVLVASIIGVVILFIFKKRRDSDEE